MKLDEILFWCARNHISIMFGYVHDDWLSDRKTIMLRRSMAGDTSESVNRPIVDSEMTPDTLEVALNECVTEFESKYKTEYV